MTGTPPEVDRFSFDGRVVVVTGAGNGLGRSHAMEFARRGAAVVVNDLGTTLDGEGRAADSGATVVREITDLGGAAVADNHSVATPEGGEAIIATALREFGQVDVVVNNAGILRDAAFKNVTPESVEAVLAVHLKGAFNVTHAAWVHMQQQHYGRVVNTSSNSGLFGNFGQSAYGAAKMGLVGLTHVLAIEGAKYGIAVNAISPVARTRMTEGLLGAAADSLDPGLVTPMVTFLAHESCTRTGNIYGVGGGKVSRVFVGVTRGIEDRELTVDAIADQIDVIDDVSSFTVPGIFRNA